VFITATAVNVYAVLLTTLKSQCAKAYKQQQMIRCIVMNVSSGANGSTRITVIS